MASNKTAVWHALGFTTTSEERTGPGPPYTTPALQANLFFRVFLGIVSLFFTYVPARLLWRNGEFAGTVLCVMMLIFNSTTIVNALIWRDNNVEEWWAGYGWCDIQVYIHFALHTAFNISLFEIMRGLATKVSLRRADKPARSEIRRQRIVSAAVIFTFPVIQVILTFFTTISRYNVSTLVGCSAVYYPGWIYLVFYILPVPVFAALAAYMAGLAFFRYQKIDKVTKDVARSQGGVAAARRERVRMKLYFFTLCCIVLVLPLIMVMLFVYIVEGGPWNRRYDFDALHFGPDPYNIYFISFTTSDMLTFSELNTSLIGVCAGILVAIPFGTTPEAINMYRGMLLAVGLGYIFPKLRKEYIPGTKRGSSFSWGSLGRALRGKPLLGSNTPSTHKDSLLLTAEQVSLANHTDRGHFSSMNQPQPRDFTMASDNLQYPEKSLAIASTHHNPWPDLFATEIDTATADIEAGRHPPARNPYPIPPILVAKPPPKFPSFSVPSLHSHKKTHPQPTAVTTTSIPSLANSSSLQSQAPGTKTGSDPGSTTNMQQQYRKDSTANFSPTSTTTSLTTAAAPSITTTAAATIPWPPPPPQGVRVETRITQRSIDLDMMEEDGKDDWEAGVGGGE
ncbi:hypothetical protein N657DRAFT_716867 [Parathielavia appendiculata]|uniref:Pheromone receptor n=1 Tax=Parathielavia appendiculata TaxID=2587402 RepID=A0AAN6U0G2_9PEZI|nr:hypothetical protein N657DRAFT_716867 [Parathielavia appendiculata]